MVLAGDQVWRDGEFVPRALATLPLLTHSLHYGLAVWDGIRAYRGAAGHSYVFRLDAHIDRLFESCKSAYLAPVPTREVFAASCLELLRVNRMQVGYLRPLVYVGEGAMGVYAPGNPVHSAIMAWEWAQHLGVDAAQHGIRAKVSSFVRHHPNAGMSKAKMTGQYGNSALARAEAQRAGYDEAILLDVHGFVSEASGSNLFLVRRGTLHTPDLSCSILEGITRDTITTLAAEAGLTVREGRLTRDQLWSAEEVFLTGTAAEIVPVREVDDRPVGDGRVGRITAELQRRYRAVTTGEDAAHSEWRTRV